MRNIPMTLKTTKELVKIDSFSLVEREFIIRSKMYSWAEKENVES